MWSRDEIFAAALRLPEAERAELAKQLFDSLDAPDEEAAAAWRVDIERRACEVMGGAIELLGYDEVMAELWGLDRE